MTRPTALGLVMLTALTTAASAATYCVSPVTGDDAAPGSAQAPWRTIGRAMGELMPGDTLVLQPGRYREQVTCSLVGTAEKPIVIRGEDGAIIDAGLAEFFDDPASAWEHVSGDVYQSRRAYRNITDVAGVFGHEPIPLVTYYLHSDLVSTNEQAGFNPETKLMDRDVYVGPGIWLDRQSGRILARLAPTHQQSPLTRDYTGPSDPRTLPLVIAPEGATPITLSDARHVRIENLTLVGGGPDLVVVRNCGHVTLKRIEAWCGRFWGQTSGHVKVLNSRFIGTIPPWIWRAEASTGCASGQIRDVARVWAHTVFDASHEAGLQGVPRVIANDAMLDRPRGRQPVTATPEDGGVPQMARMPVNHDWEIAYCEFLNGHDGVYPTGKRMHMHHCVIDNMQDDAVDFSTPVRAMVDDVVFQRNLIRRCVTAVSTHNQGRPDGKVYFTGNVVDLRTPMAWSRPTDEKPQGEGRPGNCFFMHGSDHAAATESYIVYHNTIVGHQYHRYFHAHGFLNHLKPGSVRRVFNNAFIYLNTYMSPYLSKTLEGMDLHTDHNLHWSVQEGAQPPAKYLDVFVTSGYAQALAESNGGLWEEHSFVADPMFESLSASPDAVNDYRPKKGSPAIGAARSLPSEWPGRHSQTIGAFDPGDAPLRVGVDGRITAGEPWTWQPSTLYVKVRTE